MLVLSRKKDEKIIIGDEVTVMVIEIRGYKARIGINAPPGMTVHRSEVWELIKKEGSTSTPTQKKKLGKGYLILSREKNEKIIIGDKITVMVIEIRGDKVRLGIDAPKEVTVHRQEVYEAIKREQEAPNGISVDALDKPQ